MSTAATEAPRSKLAGLEAIAIKQPRRRRNVRWLGVGIGIAFFVLYWRTLAPDVVGHDAGEFQFVPYIFGIPHATGYPLYLLLGKAWSLLPLGSVAWRMNLLSALLGGLAAALTYGCGLELTGRASSGVIAALAVGLAPLEWTWSTIAGVRSLAVAFVAAVVLAALRWERLRDEKAFLLLALVVGLALDHHRTIALLLPVLGLYVLIIKPRALLNAKAAALAILPLSLYGVLWWRAATGAPWDQDHAGTWKGFVNLALGSTVSSAHLDVPFSQAAARAGQLAQALPGVFSPLVLALALAGLMWLALRRPAAALLLGGYIVVLAWFTLQWDVGRQLNLVYFMPAYVPLALLAGSGVAAIAAGVEDLAGARLCWRQSMGARQAALGAASVLVIAVAVLGLRMDRAHRAAPPETLDDFRQELFQGHQARRLADAFGRLPPGSTVVADWDQATVLWYAQFVDHLNPTATIAYPATAMPASARGPIFLATATVRPPAGTSVSADGPFVQVLRQPATALPDRMVPVGCAFDGQIELAGIAPLGSARYGVLPVTLYWKALRRPVANYAVSVRLMSTPDRVAAQRDEAAPVLGLSPTSHWLPGQVTADYYELDTRGLPARQYELAVVMYQPLPGGGFRNLSCGGASRAVAATLRLPLP